MATSVTRCLHHRFGLDLLCAGLLLLVLQGHNTPLPVAGCHGHTIAKSVTTGTRAVSAGITDGVYVLELAEMRTACKAVPGRVLAVYPVAPWRTLVPHRCHHFFL